MPRPRMRPLVLSGPQVALGDLSEDGAARLRDYCRRARWEPNDYVDRPWPNGGSHRVRYVGARLRALIWEDIEVREFLRRLCDSEGWQRDAHATGCSPCDLLDLVSAMSLEAEGRAA